MSVEIEAEGLTTFEVSGDGMHVRLHATAVGGEPVALTFSSDWLRQLIMTLPNIASQALRRRFGDEQLRIVYPMGDWKIETTGEHNDTFVVTMGTPDGFEVSFALSSELMCDFGRSVSNTGVPMRSMRRLVN